MSLLSAPEAKALLDEAQVDPDDIRSSRWSLTSFLQRYLPLFYRKEQAKNATFVVAGLVSDLKRKTCEPIAIRNGVARKPIQFFVGAGKWNDEAVMSEISCHVVEAYGEDQGVLILDPTYFAKKGTESCGVQRQWNGRIGKVDNCQVGVFLAYGSSLGYGPLERRLYLPEKWAKNTERREKTHVPEEIVFRKKWEMALDMIDEHARLVPHGWIVGDDEFGRAAEMRAALRKRNERYVLDVPCNTLVRDLEKAPPKGRRVNPFERVDRWVARQPPSRLTRLKVRDGEKGPFEVQAVSIPVKAKQEQRVGPEERLLYVKTLEEKPRVTFALTNAARDVPLEELVRVQCQRPRIEQLFREAKGEAGLAHYEVRSWVGWHHHMTLSLLALWFLIIEGSRLGEKNTGANGSTGPRHHLAVAS